ncbi:MAG TPA: fatty acid metabolism transcriptional regulator FadR [Roseiflexaceae bacterium]|nr:fatty acid metabolism transcriptional regulator FadR [Roseiflexaceae bacterium]
MTIPFEASPPARPLAHAEQALLTAILEGVYPPGGALPAERELATRLGVTRPTLREALQRLARDGWLTIRQGKPTRVNDFWREGGLNILSHLAAHGQHLPAGFVVHLLEARQALAPAYTRAAVARAPEEAAALLEERPAADDPAEHYAAFDWRLHRELAVGSGNPIYPLILNGFAAFYEQMARRYFAPAPTRARSQEFYAALLSAARAADAEQAARLAEAVCQDSIKLWEGLGAGE